MIKKSTLITLIIILVIVIFSYYIITKDNTHQDADETFAKCLGEKSTIYIQTGCHACKTQEEMFGDNYKYLNVVDCLVEPLKCTIVDIKVTPTWIVQGKKYEGVRSIEELKNASGC
jgi:hypothetical protein